MTTSSASSASRTDRETQRQAEHQAETERPWLWNVVLIDDDDHSYDYVITMTRKLFGHPMERAFEIAKSVDSQGRAILLTTHREHAELKRDQVHSFGRDRLISSCNGSMSAIIEPAECGDDDHSEDPAE